MRTRTTPLTALLLALALVAGACGLSRDGGDAAAVRITYPDGDVTTILSSEIDELFEANTTNERLIELNQGTPFPDTYRTDLANQLISVDLLRSEIDRLGGEITAEDETEAREDLLDQLRSFYPDEAEVQTAADELSVFLGLLIDTRAGQLAFERALADTAPDDAVGVPCVRHILLETEEAAVDVIGRIDGGEDFAAVAIEASTGPSGPAGGDLGCSPSTNYVPEFRDAVDAAEVGQVVGPVQTQFGFHVVEVTGYEVQTLELAQQRFGEAFSELEVEVLDSDNLGQWSEGLGQIVAPTS